MAGEMVTSSQSARTSPPFGPISILVVDDDTTCLSIVAAILKSWKYEVVTVKHPIDALCTLRIKGGSFDVVVTDVHMPDMNGFELQKQIHEEFKLPVVFMSADDNDGIILKGLQSGAAFFIVKPIAPDDLKNLWQYAVSKKKGKTIIEEIGSIQETSQADIACNEDTPVQETSQTDKCFNEVESESSVNEDRLSAKDSKRKAKATDSNAGNNGENKDDSGNPKKPKVVWTNALHNQFLEAIRSIGLERSVPKKILELMNVTGLTRENVASHLQKYRIFLKRVSEASCKIQSAAERSMVERTFGSSFASGQPSLMYNRSRLRYMQNLEQEQMRTPFQRRNRGHFPVVEAPILGHSSSSDPKASSNNSTSQFGSGKSLKQPMIDSAKPLYQANPSGLRMELPKSFTNGLSKYNSTAGYGKIGAFSNSNSNLNPNYYNTNYVGYRMAGDGRLIGLASTDFNYNNGLMNGMQNGNMRNVPLSHNASHISPTVINSIRQESNSLPQLPTTLQQNCFSNGGESDYIFGLLNNFSDSDSNSYMQPYDEGDLSFTFLNQVNIQSPTRQEGEEALSSDFSFSSYHVEDNPPVNKQSLEQQPGGELVVSKFGIAGNQSDEYFPLFEQNPSQQDDEEFLESLFGHGEYGGPGGDDNPRGL